MNSSPPPRRGRLWKRLALLLGSTVVFCLLAEGALRVRQKIKYGTFRHTVVDQRYRDEATGLVVPRPGQAIGAIRINSLGFRSPELERPKPPGRIRLAFLGGSTTYCAEASSNEAAWPHLVWKRLTEEFPGTRFDYLNAGVPGYGTRHSTIALETRVKPLDPDVVVIYQATNDLASDTRELARAQGLWKGDADAMSWLARWSLAWFLIEKNLTVYRRQRQAAAGVDRLRFDAREVAARFRQRLAALVRKAQETAPVVVLATFSHRARRGQSRDELLEALGTALYYAPYMSLEGFLDALDAYNDAIRDVARETGAVLAGGEDAIPADDAHFKDSVHFTDEGCRKMAGRVVEALLRSAAFRRLLRRVR